MVVESGAGQKNAVWDPKIVGATVATRIERQKRLAELL
jgi:hypothetical protein